MNSGFTATVTCDFFSQTYQGEPGSNKKSAEQAAAKVVLASEFPEEFAKVDGGMG